MKLPEGWMWVGGELPDHNPGTRSLDNYPWLSEAVFITVTENGNWCVDCCYVSEGSSSGQYSITLWWYKYDDGEMPVRSLTSCHFQTIREELHRLIRWADTHPEGPGLYE